jgi:hypothetical protein
MKLTKMCTSVAIGFYLRDEESFKDFKQKILKISKAENSIFSVYEKKPVTKSADVPTGVVQKI